MGQFIIRDDNEYEDAIFHHKGKHLERIDELKLILGRVILLNEGHRFTENNAIAAGREVLNEYYRNAILYSRLSESYSNKHRLN